MADVKGTVMKLLITGACVVAVAVCSSCALVTSPSDSHNLAGMYWWASGASSGQLSVGADSTWSVQGLLGDYPLCIDGASSTRTVPVLPLSGKAYVDHGTFSFEGSNMVFEADSIRIGEVVIGTINGTHSKAHLDWDYTVEDLRSRSCSARPTDILLSVDPQHR